MTGTFTLLFTSQKAPWYQMDTEICTVAQHYFPPEVVNLSWIAATGYMTLVTISVKVEGGG